MKQTTTGQRKPNRGHFCKGHDPRRHVLTSEERSAGFWNALASVQSRYPDAVDKSGRHMSCNFLSAVQTRRALRS